MKDKKRKKEHIALDKVITFRLRENDYLAYKKEAEKLDLSMTDFIRSQIDIKNIKPVITHKKVNKQAPKNRKYTKVDPQLLFALAKIGNNINQISRAINYRKNNFLENVNAQIALFSLDQQLKIIRDNHNQSL